VTGVPEPAAAAYEAISGPGPSLAGVVRRVNASARRILEVGCGDGELLVELASTLPDTAVFGVELSEANVSLARRRLLDAGLAGRVTVVLGDYVEARLGSFDAIVAKSALHLIRHADEQVFAALGRDLEDGGCLVATVPSGCLYNRVLWGVRRVLRRLPHAGVEAAALWIARRLHPDITGEQLRQRLQYLYSLPARFDGPAMRAAAWGYGGLTVVEAAELPPASLAQPRHRLLVFTRTVTAPPRGATP
jgi:SAM-dependent methyltransferase